MHFFFYALILLVFSLASLRAQKASLLRYELGDLVKDFKLKSTSGKRISLRHYRRGRGLILIFMCNECPFAQNYLERVKALHARYASYGVPVVVVNSNSLSVQAHDSYDHMRALARSERLRYEYLADDAQVLARQYQVQSTPHAFVLANSDQGFRIIYTGAIDDNALAPAKISRSYVSQAVEDLLARRPVDVARTPVRGCGISWLPQGDEAAVGALEE